MTAEEIRSEVRENLSNFTRKFSLKTDSDLLLMVLYGVTAEIAAQLAELNEGLREGEFVLFRSREDRHDGR